MKTALVIAALVIVIYLMAGQASVTGGSTVTGPYDQVPGGGLSGPLSPAMAGGQPTNSADNMLRMAVNVQLPSSGGVGYGGFNRDVAANESVQGTVTPTSWQPLASARPSLGLGKVDTVNRIANRLVKI